MVNKEASGFSEKVIESDRKSFWNSNYFHWFLFFTLNLILFYSVIEGLISEWYLKPNASHGFLVPFILFFLIWRKKEEIKAQITGDKFISALLVSIIGLLFYIIGEISLVNILQRAGFMLFLISSSIFLIGKSAAKEISFPIVYSLFMIPLPVTLYDYLTFPMKKISTFLSAEIISLLSVPVYREGNVIHMPNVTLEVVNACSGLNAIISVLAIGTFWGYLVLKNYSKRAAFFFLLIPIAIVANIVRIVFTALISNYLTVDITRSLIHEFSGTLFVIVVAFTLILFFSKILK